MTPVASQRVDAPRMLPTRVKCPLGFIAASTTETAKRRPPVEPLLRGMRTHRLSPSSFVRLRGSAVFGRLVAQPRFFRLWQLLSESGRGSGPEAREGAVVFFSVCQLRPARRRALGAATE